MAYTAAPTLHTGRLYLRAHQASDLEDCITLWTDPVVTRYTIGSAPQRQDVWARLLRHPGHWALLGFGYWLVCEQATDRVLGEVGLADFKRDLMQSYVEFAGIPEAGWVLMPWAHGRGYASEAVEAVLNWRDAHLPGRETICLIHPENAASFRVAHSFGFQERQRVGEGEHQSTLLVRTRASANERR